MRIVFFSSFLLILFSCSLRTPRPQEKKAFTKENKAISRDEVLRGYVKKKIPRTGEYSSVTDGFVTTEFYRSDDAESSFILERGELRVETEARKAGITLTRTWQDGVLTSMTVAGRKRTTLIYFDREGDFLKKIVTIEGRDTPTCYHYKEGKPSVMEDASCLSLIPDFD